MRVNLSDAPPTFIQYALKIPALHTKILASALQEMPDISAEVLTKALSERVPPQDAVPIRSSLLQIWQERNIKIQSFVSTVIYALETDLCYWPIIQWRETNGSEGMMIFLLEGADNDKVSWIMHRGQPQGSAEWSRSKVAWRVRDTESLKSLCYAAMHFENVLSWTPEEIVNLYCHVQPQLEASGQQ